MTAGGRRWQLPRGCRQRVASAGQGLNRLLNGADVGVRLAVMTLRCARRAVTDRPRRWRRSRRRQAATTVNTVNPVGIIVIALVLAAGCGISDPPARAASPAWVRRDLIPASKIAAAGGVFVVHAVRKGRLEILGLDAATGATRWAHPATPSYTLAGVGLQTSVSGTTVVWMRPRGDTRSGAAQVTALDARTGRTLWSSGRADQRISVQPAWCGTRAQQLCLVTTDARNRRRHWVTLEATSGAPIGRTPVDDNRHLTDELVPARDGTYLRRLGGAGHRGWSRPITEVFARGGLTPDLGWNVQQRDGRYVGWLDSAQAWTPRTTTLQLGRGAVAGWDAATGGHLWTAPGTSLMCGAVEFDLQHPARCRTTGQLTYTDADQPIARRGAVTMEGFDPATGATRWSWAAGPASGLIVRDGSVIRASQTTYLVRSSSGAPVLLDLDRGPRPAPADLSGWCSSARNIRLPTPVVFTGFAAYHVTQYWPCRLGGAQLTQPPSTPDFAGARSGTHFAWASPTGIHGFGIR